MNKLIVISGLTASGKTALSVQLAQKYHGEIVSADSRQVYQGLDIGTAKITPAEMHGVPHHLLDVVDPTANTRYSVGDFQRDAYPVIDAIIARGHVPFWWAVPDCTAVRLLTVTALATNRTRPATKFYKSA